MANINKLNEIASSNSNWIEEAKKRRENREWQKHSQKIAIKILRAIREKNINQKQLAEIIGVSPQQINKIVKGKENLTLQSIAKIEKALNIELIFSKEENNISYLD
ncbi:MAG: transcriptional regulator [Candidatus Woesearchaeota archaeon]|nr:MAG: transcriptional regulator [Candidatus Woesearchaeota archaeon]